MRLTKEQQDCIGDTGRLTRAAIAAIYHMAKFTIGTYMIKKVKEWDSNSNKVIWIGRTFGKNKKYRKYKVVAVDEYGIPFYRKVLFNGKLCDELRYMGNLDFRYVKFLVDPDMQDFILLGGKEEDFDAIGYNTSNVSSGITNN